MLCVKQWRNKKWHATSRWKLTVVDILVLVCHKRFLVPSDYPRRDSGRGKYLDEAVWNLFYEGNKLSISWSPHMLSRLSAYTLPLSPSSRVYTLYVAFHPPSWQHCIVVRKTKPNEKTHFKNSKIWFHFISSNVRFRYYLYYNRFLTLL